VEEKKELTLAQVRSPLAPFEQAQRKCREEERKFSRLHDSRMWATGTINEPEEHLAEATCLWLLL